MRKVKVGNKYRHFKGKDVLVLYLAKDSETMEDLVVYKHIDDDVIWVRKMDMFLSKVDKEKYPDIKQEYRFEEVKEWILK